MAIPLVDLQAQLNSVRDEINASLQRVVESGRFILGPEVEGFERDMAVYSGTRFAVGVASGTDALHLALLACDIRPGDEVITTPFTFIATAEAIARCGATPVFVDIDRQSCNMDPSRIEAKITSRTRAVLPVHLYGQAADMAPIMKLAHKYDLKVVEDCAQAAGAEYEGKKVGSVGDAGCLSFFPSKNLGAYGDGGMVVTSNADIAETVDLLRKHGARTSYHCLRPGFNSRLDALQAAVLRVKLGRLDEWIELRREKAAIYNRLLSPVDAIETPFAREFGEHAFNYYTIRLKDANLGRDELRRHLESRGIQSMVYYPLSLHLQQIYDVLEYEVGDFPESEMAQEQVLSLPMYPELSEEQIHEVAGCIREFVESRVSQH